MNRFLVQLIAVTLLALPATAQEKTPAIGLANDVRACDVEILTYTPRQFTAPELLATANELFGDTILVRLDDGKGNYDGGGSAHVGHFILLGVNLLIRDARKNGESIILTLQTLEETELKRAAANDARAVEANRLHAEQASDTSDGSPEKLTPVQELRARHLSFEAFSKALAPFVRSVFLPSYNGRSESADNMTAVRDANLILIRETADRLAQIRALIDRIDLPLPQVMVTATVVRAVSAKVAANSPGPSGPANVPATIPPAIYTALTQLSPNTAFGLVSIGALRCSIQPGKLCRITTRSQEGTNWNLSFAPEAFDPQTGELALANCEFELTRNETTGFSTNLSIHIGENVILGAVGTEPYYVALRVEAVKSAN